MKRPPLAEILTTITNTVHLQFATSGDGRRLAEFDAAAVAAMEGRIAANVAQIVDTWLDEATEE